MTSLVSDEALWAAGVSARLKVVQASFADDEPATRQDYLAEELDRALKEVPVGRRKLYLEALAEQFPLLLGEQPTVADSDEAADTLVDTSPLAESESFDSLFARFAQAAAQLSDEDKHIVAQQLAQEGLVFVSQAASAAATSGGGETEPVPPELQKRLGLQEGQTLDRQRVLRFIGILTDLSVTLDQLVWNVWKSLAPNSLVRRDGGAELRKLAAPYLLGDSEVSTTQIAQHLDKTRQLIGGLMAAIGATGENFARSYLARYSPGAIKEAADAEPGFFLGPEQKCWRKYMQLFNETSGVAIENEITNAIVKYAEELMLGTGRSTSTRDT